MLKRLILSATMMVAIGILAACGNLDTGPAETGQMTDSERIAYILGDRVLEPISQRARDRVVQLGYLNCDHMIAAPVAYQSGIYEALGINVAVTGHTGVPENMAAGNMDVAYVLYNIAIRGYLAGSPLFISAQNHTGGSVYLVVANHIQTPQDLIGATVVLGGDRDVLKWAEIARRMGIPADESYYNNVIIASDAARYQALYLGEIDAFMTCDPFGSLATYNGTGWIMATASTMFDGMMGTCCKVVMHYDFANEYPELAERMLLAHVTSIQFLYLFPYRAAEIFAHRFEMPMEVALMSIHKKLNGEGRTITWDMSVERLQNQIYANDRFDVRIEMTEELDMRGLTADHFVDLSFFNRIDAPDFDTFIRERVDPIFPLGMSLDEFTEAARARHEG
ncbi:MAG: ABC transporter substrate-binding protein [Defluviitaleaceae bacterium]|nr:ABC transporter substrate-binding protein [Defluviitaleaceae bacterium]